VVPDALTGGPHFAAYCERYVRHTKGRWAGRPLIYEDWQREFWWEALEFDPATGLRIYKEVGLGLPRKNSKSTMASGAGLYMLDADGESEPEVYVAAAARNQAGIVMGQSISMVRRSPLLLDRLRPYRSLRIECARNGGIMRSLSSDGALQHGLNPSANIIDELHAHKSAELYTALTTGTGAALADESDPAQIIRIGQGASWVDRVEGCREALWRVVEDARGGGAVASGIIAMLELAYDDLEVGRWDDAEQLVDEAIGVCEAHGYQPLTWLGRFFQGIIAACSLAYGERLRRSRAMTESRVQLNAALATFERLGARLWVDRTTTELRATGQTKSRAGDYVLDRLTPQELEIATLAASGLTNKQIGERLFLSHRTVGGHLHRAFPKLGVSTRAALRDAPESLPPEQLPRGWRSICERGSAALRAPVSCRRPDRQSGLPRRRIESFDGRPPRGAGASIGHPRAHSSSLPRGRTAGTTRGWKGEERHEDRRRRWHRAHRFEGRRPAH
jgi:DNA-binding CsgD family transcriptional regulator